MLELHGCAGDGSVSLYALVWNGGLVSSRARLSEGLFEGFGVSLPAYECSSDDSLTVGFTLNPVSLQQHF